MSVSFPQVENGKLSEHEHSSTMEHVRLLLPMVVSLCRTRTEISESGEWQEDSGLGLYRAPEEGVNMGAGAAASVHSVDLEKKVGLKIEHFFLFFLFFFSRFDILRGSSCICGSSSTGHRFGKHRLRPEPGGGAQRRDVRGLRSPTRVRPGKDRKPVHQTVPPGAGHRHERPADVWDRAAGARTPVLHLRRDIRLENLRILTPQAGSRGRPHASHVLTR